MPVEAIVGLVCWAVGLVGLVLIMVAIVTWERRHPRPEALRDPAAGLRPTSSAVLGVSTQEPPR
jgi:uncharacterized iron-regulated membrane protein